MKKNHYKILAKGLVFVLICCYAYYNYLSFDIYREIHRYKKTENYAAVNMAKEIVVLKYPYTIPYFLVK